MKRNVMIVLCTLLCVTGMYGCGAEKTENTAVQEDSERVIPMEQENATYGEIQSVSEDTMTLAIGTRKKMDKGSDEKPKETESMLELTGETKEFTLTGNTKVVRQEMGGMRGERPSGQDMPEGEAPEKPDGEMPEGESPEKPSGEMPEKPSGGQPDGGHSFETEEIALSDLQEGDTVAITLDEDENVEEIRLMTRRDAE